MEKRVETTRKDSGKLRCHPSRLQMHAPSSIQVGPRSLTDAAEWNAAIPFLSPLDAMAVPWAAAAADHIAEDEGLASSRDEARPPAIVTEDKGEQQVPAQWLPWRHPAMPLCYEPAPGNSPALILPHCR